VPALRLLGLRECPRKWTSRLACALTHALQANCYKRVFEDATKPPACMSPECRKILSADNLLQAFSAAYVTTVRALLRCFAHQGP
jgi:hypothetical protein